METGFFSILRVVLVLLAMVSGMVLLYRYGGKLRLNLRAKPGEYGLKRVETIHLGYKKFVSVVEVRDRVLILGVGEKEMSLLANLPKDEKAL